MDRVRKILAKHGIDAGVEDIGGIESYLPYFIRVTFGRRMVKNTNGTVRPTTPYRPPFVLKGRKAIEFSEALTADGLENGRRQKVEAVREVLTREEIDEIHSWAKSSDTHPPFLQFHWA